MNFDEVVHYIDHSMKFGCRPGLERTAKLLELLGNPHKKLKCIHVAGTNGKGSTTAMLSNILKCAGYRTGVYTSPHLYRITERMTIDGKEISKEDFLNFALQVIDKMNSMKEAGLEEPTQFEMLTAMAFLYFESKKVDYAVIEVGLGGNYDATNVIDAMLSIITSISMDHMDILGNTIELIATEKAGIIKKDRTAVLYPQLFPKAEQIVEETCKTKNARLIKADAKGIVQKQYSSEGQCFDYCTTDYCLKDLSLSLLGDHQLKNAAVVLEAVKALKGLGCMIDENAVRMGLATAVWPCRLSIIKRNPLILIDGAHNEDGINSLKAALLKYFMGKRIIFVMGMLGDKDYMYGVKELMPLAYAAVATEPVSYRALKAEELAKHMNAFCSHVEAEPDIEKAIKRAMELCHEGDMICICGSLYLAGSALEILQNRDFK